MLSCPFNKYQLQGYEAWGQCIYYNEIECPRRGYPVIVFDCQIWSVCFSFFVSYFSWFRHRIQYDVPIVCLWSLGRVHVADGSASAFPFRVWRSETSECSRAVCLLATGTRPQLGPATVLWGPVPSSHGQTPQPEKSIKTDSSPTLLLSHPAITTHPLIPTLTHSLYKSLIITYLLNNLLI